MRPFVSLSVLLLTTACVVAAPAPFAKTERPDRRTEAEKLQGEWRMVRITNGEQVLHNIKFNYPKTWGLIVAPGRCAFFLGLRRQVRCGITVGPHSNPKTMDVTYPEPHESWQMPYLCIYRLDGDTLTIRFDPDRTETERPKDFAGRTWVFERGPFNR
jgi:uncharacterized protein (TIGR03067 family)